MRAERGDPSVWKEVHERVTCSRRSDSGAQAKTYTNPESFWQRAVYPPLIDHLIQEMNDRLLSQEDRFLGQQLLPPKLQGLSNDVQDNMYAAYKNDLTDKREYDNEMFRWKTKWLHLTGERPPTLADILDCINPTLYWNVNTIFTILLMMPVSNATPGRSLSTMCRVKTYLQATTNTERISALIHAYTDNDWRGSRGSWILREEEQDAKLRISMKLRYNFQLDRD